jgi:hypothetical protein
MADENTSEVTDESAETVEPVEAVTEEPDTFTREYVTEIRKEAADHRAKSKAMATRLHTELVRSTGRLADPTELLFDAAHLEDPEALTAAIDDLLTRKPHYAARTPQGHVGQGVKDQGAQAGNFMAHLKTLV